MLVCEGGAVVVLAGRGVTSIGGGMTDGGLLLSVVPVISCLSNAARSAVTFGEGCPRGDSTSVGVDGFEGCNTSVAGGGTAERGEATLSGATVIVGAAAIGGEGSKGDFRGTGSTFGAGVGRGAGTAVCVGAA